MTRLEDVHVDVLRRVQVVLDPAAGLRQLVVAVHQLGGVEASTMDRPKLWPSAKKSLGLLLTGRSSS
jgi:hypothetical protein